MRRITYNILTFTMLLAIYSCEPTPTYTLDTEDESGQTDGTTDDSTDDTTDTTGPNSTTSITSIAELKSLYKGATTRITVVSTITGTVVANDRRGEFDEVIVLDDGYDGIQISVSNGNLFTSYPLGSTISCQCEDLYIGSDYGVLRLGVAPSNSNEVVGVIEDDMLRKVIFTGSYTQLIPKIVKISELTNGLISRFIRIEEVRFETIGVPFCETDQESGRDISTSHTLVDKWGNSVRLFVPYSVDYSDATVPEGWININAIIESSSGGIYTLRQTDYGIDECD